VHAPPINAVETSRKLPSNRRLVVFAAACLVAAIYMPQVEVGLFFLFLGLIIITFAGILSMSSRWRLYSHNKYRIAVTSLHANDIVPTILSDFRGRIVSRNLATDQFSTGTNDTIGDVFSKYMTNSSVVFRQILTRLEVVEAARDVFHVRGRSIIVTATKTRFADILWRVDTIVDRPSGQRSSDQLAVPMLTASRAGTVLYMNEAMRQFLGGRRSNLDRIFDKLPLVHDQIHDVATSEGTREMRIALFEGALGRLEVFIFEPTLGAGPA